jgi:tetratricopeptide (TPR) repeat protein
MPSITKSPSYHYFPVVILHVIFYFDEDLDEGLKLWKQDWLVYWDFGAVGNRRSLRLQILARIHKGFKRGNLYWDILADYVYFMNDFTEAVTRKPTYRDAWLALGRIHYDLGRNEEARKAYENIVTLDSRCTEAWMALGELLIIKGDYDKAEEIFRMVLRRDSKNGDAWYNLGTVLEYKGEINDAKHAHRNAHIYGTSLDG